jgi:hypothetical protein
MPNKRSKRKTKGYFFCCFCNQQMLRLGSPKHQIYYTEASEIKQHLGVSLKTASLLAAQGELISGNIWIEEFFCEEHGRMWMVVTKKEDVLFANILASQGDWGRTTKTTNPNIPNPSVSEYSYRMSRRSNNRLTKNLYGSHNL